jgi:hypothetical protein
MNNFLASFFDFNSVNKPKTNDSRENYLQEKPKYRFKNVEAAIKHPFGPD